MGWEEDGLSSDLKAGCPLEQPSPYSTKKVRARGGGEGARAWGWGSALPVLLPSAMEPQGPEILPCHVVIKVYLKHKSS